MAPYIAFNTEKRKGAKDDFEKDLFKLLNNAVFGKSMEDVRKRRDIRFATTQEQFRKLVVKANFQSFKILSENLVVVQLRKTEIVLDKPISTGLAVLDLSKLLMYEFHYDVMLARYGAERLKLILTDTDSFLYEIRTEDISNDFKEMAEHFDFSDYPPEHDLFCSKNKKVIGDFFFTSYIYR